LANHKAIFVCPSGKTPAGYPTYQQSPGPHFIGENATQIRIWMFEHDARSEGISEGVLIISGAPATHILIKMPSAPQLQYLPLF